MNTNKKPLIGTTSWLIPGTYYENACIVSEIVDFVELLVFTWDEETKKLLSSEVKKLSSLTERHGLLYTVHLPTDNIENVKEAYSFLSKSGLKIINYVLHPITGIDILLSKHGSDISLENLKERVVFHENLTLDIGHHLLGEKLPRKYIKKVKEVHLMGVSEREDHLKLNEEALHELNKIFNGNIREIPMICLEIFNLNDMLESIALLKRHLKVTVPEAPQI